VQLYLNRFTLRRTLEKDPRALRARASRASKSEVVGSSSVPRTDLRGPGLQTDHGAWEFQVNGSAIRAGNRTCSKRASSYSADRRPSLRAGSSIKHPALITRAFRLGMAAHSNDERLLTKETIVRSCTR
jgi:hypothetical protein